MIVWFRHKKYDANNESAATPAKQKIQEKLFQQLAQNICFLFNKKGFVYFFKSLICGKYGRAFLVKMNHHVQQRYNFFYTT